MGCTLAIYAHRHWYSMVTIPQYILVARELEQLEGRLAIGGAGLLAIIISILLYQYGKQRA